MDKTFLEKVENEPLWQIAIAVAVAAFGVELAPFENALESMIQALGALMGVWYARSRVTPFRQPKGSPSS